MLGRDSTVIFSLLLSCNHVSNDVWNRNCTKIIKYIQMQAVIWNNNDLKICESYLIEALLAQNGNWELIFNILNISRLLLWI